MTVLTLASDQAGCDWPKIEGKLRDWWPDLASVSKNERKRAYKVNFPDHGQPIPLLQELQGLLDKEDIHFFLDLKP